MEKESEHVGVEVGGIMKIKKVHGGKWFIKKINKKKVEQERILECNII